MVIGYVDKENQYASSEVKFGVAIGSIIPLSYYIGMGIARPLVYTVSALLPAAYIIVAGNHGAVVHWSRWRSLIILVVATVLTSACADLVTENIQPILNQPSVSQVGSRGFWACSPGSGCVASWNRTNVPFGLLQYFIGVTVLAMVPEIPEIVNGIQFALYNNISLSLEVGICIAVQVCMIQIPILVLFNAFYVQLWWSSTLFYWLCITLRHLQQAADHLPADALTKVGS
ncbi:unnamed protein product [Tetraodon nigroviridis]|uniref:(spotted green pufferfish) hypothetical protein n=1 Tax=Tetraodon nigroviridis TaxID=99883 RepID=Q4S7H4_TETNG|nr:unnamed protein product [Tetraodon nigroviridis]